MHLEKPKDKKQKTDRGGNLLWTKPELSDSEKTFLFRFFILALLEILWVTLTHMHQIIIFFTAENSAACFQRLIQSYEDAASDWKRLRVLFLRRAAEWFLLYPLSSWLHAIHLFHEVKIFLQAWTSGCFCFSLYLFCKVYPALLSGYLLSVCPFLCRQLYMQRSLFWLHAVQRVQTSF